MKKTKIAAIALSATMLFTTTAGIAGCSKKDGSTAIKNKVVQVEEDSMWFDYQKTKIDVGDLSGYDYSWLNEGFVKSGDYYYTYLETATFNDNYYESESTVIKLDSTGNVVEKTKLTPKALGVDEKFNDMYISNICERNGQAYVIANFYYFDEKTFESEDFTIIYNLDTGETESLDYLLEKMGKNSYSNGLGFLSNGYDYLIEYVPSGEYGSYKIHLGKDGAFVKTIDVQSESNIKNCYGLSSDPVVSGSVVKFNVWGEDQDINLCIDTNSMTITTEPWSYDPYEESFVGSDGKEYVAKQDGIYCGDEIVMPYNCTYCNASAVSYCNLLSADGDNFVISVSEYKNGYSECYFYTFNKADSNPNAGKDIITVGMIGEVDSITSEAICQFNESSDKYFLKTQNYLYEYNEEDMEDSENWSDADYQKYYVEKEGSIANDLSMDLLNGEGPDILVNASAFPQLNNDEYLLDLSDFYSSELGSIPMFDNIIEASQKDGKLYQFPLSFTVNGILASSKDVKGEKGFTFDEYIEYVDKVCNGKSPIGLFRGRLDVFTSCLAAMSDQFYDEDGNVTFSNEAFYQLAEYCRDNVPEEPDYGSDDGFYYGVGVGYSIGGDDALNSYTNLYSATQYLGALEADPNVKLYGVPSIDGRGPSINIINSIAISAAASNEDAAKEFLKFVISTDSLFENVYANPISISACEEAAKVSIDDNNKMYDDQLRWGTEAELHSWGMYRYDYSSIDKYIEVLKTGSCIAEIDPNIELIIMDEILPYFAGQKKIEEVTPIIEDRAQTVIDER